MSTITDRWWETRGVFLRFDDEHDWPTPDEWEQIHDAPGAAASQGKLVYFIEARISGLIKIGISNDPWRRMCEIGTDKTTRMLAVETGGRYREQVLHAEFSRYSMNNVEGFLSWPEAWATGGSEWFMPGRPIMDYIG